ncbi:MAG TPA: transposase [Stellaceae bacterium]|nr:transposase [Stellaceae bacterium]
MPEYRRLYVPGATYFFTVNLLDRRSDLLVTHIDLVRQAVRKVGRELPFNIEAWVVLPDHIHCLWKLPQGDSDFPARWQAIKMEFTKALSERPRPSPVMVRRREGGIWQRRYWEHLIRDDRDYGAHIDYIHFNPVKHGLTATPAEWPFSTFRRAVAAGLYPADWLPTADEPANTGERSEQ